VAGGPLIPGLQEFDAPRPRRTWIGWVAGIAAATAVLVVVAGFVGGVGPLSILGVQTTPLSAVGYRPGEDPRAVDIAVAVPSGGLCGSDAVTATAFERSGRVEVEASVSRLRRTDCPPVALGGDVRWVTATLQAPLDDRPVIRLPDREPLPRRD
jgi:hypothetical protein